MCIIDREVGEHKKKDSLCLTGDSKVPHMQTDFMEKRSYICRLPYSLGAAGVPLLSLQVDIWCRRVGMCHRKSYCLFHKPMGAKNKHAHPSMFRKITWSIMEALQ